jgi:hypothetical protein
MTHDVEIVTRLFSLALAAEIGASQLDRKRVAKLARDAAGEIVRLCRVIEALEARLEELQREGHRC